MSEKWTEQQRVEYDEILKGLRQAGVLAKEAHDLLSKRPSFWSRLKVFLCAMVGRYP